MNVPAATECVPVIRSPLWKAFAGIASKKQAIMCALCVTLLTVMNKRITTEEHALNAFNAIGVVPA